MGKLKLIQDDDVLVALAELLVRGYKRRHATKTTTASPDSSPALPGPEKRDRAAKGKQIIKGAHAGGTGK